MFQQDTDKRDIFMGCNVTRNQIPPICPLNPSLRNMLQNAKTNHLESDVGIPLIKVVL